ncbi:MAG TPA: alpha-galactosidase [Chthonomonadaceae bacterium]|nr:alpha-galactosidase [Chthonomonadaceae bacterium]
MQLQNEALTLKAQPDGTGLTLTAPGWNALRLGPLTAGLTINGEKLQVARRAVEPAADGLNLVTEFAPVEARLTQQFRVRNGATIQIQSVLENRSGQAFTLNAVQLLGLDEGQQGEARLAQEPAAIRVYEQGSYWARVRRIGTATKRERTSGEEDASTVATHASQIVWVGYDAVSRQALLVGYETGERWIGGIATEGRAGEFPSGWAVRFDGGDLRVEPGERLDLEDVLLMAGSDPWNLLESYADQVAQRHHVQPLAAPPVSWCSWYPYRLGLTEERALANGQIAAERLKPLGMQFIEMDLGWESGYLPSAFEENDQFAHGLKRLSEQLEELGLKLGAWKGPFSISGHDPLSKEHPEWLLGGNGQKPLDLGEWFWEPHGATYALDLTHPGAQEWLRGKMRSLAQRGVRYFKPDFISGVTSGSLRERHDPRIVAGGGVEAARIGMKIIQEELKAADPNALVLNCGCPDIPGTGAFPLLYTCNDTGNTGYVGWRHLREDYGQNVAGHLFKQGRWGVIQPSCLCVGLPGTLEEARLRATATFLAGGQVDISDELTTLPEDRWQVLEATLPPLGKPARPVDLFDPISATSLSYEGMCKGEDNDDKAIGEQDVSRVWQLPVQTDWDAWELIGLFNYDLDVIGGDGKFPLITKFQLPLERLGLDSGTAYWAYEFWSGQFLGQSPFIRQNPRGYVHPGDQQPLIATPEAGLWEVSFFGPSVKLLVVRKARPHPWIVGTSFHQSGGVELEGVAWEGNALHGTLRRPAGHQGTLAVAGSPGAPTQATVGGKPVAVRRGANGALLLPITTESDTTAWEVRW